MLAELRAPPRNESGRGPSRTPAKSRRKKGRPRSGRDWSTRAVRTPTTTPNRWWRAPIGVGACRQQPPRRPTQLFPLVDLIPWCASFRPTAPPAPTGASPTAAKTPGGIASGSDSLASSPRLRESPRSGETWTRRTPSRLAAGPLGSTNFYFFFRCVAANWREAVSSDDDTLCLRRSKSSTRIFL